MPTGFNKRAVNLKVLKVLEFKQKINKEDGPYKNAKENAKSP